MSDFRKSNAYFLEVNEKDNQYIIGNREYMYIGYNTKSLSEIVLNDKEWKRYYLYDDGSKPWENDSYMKQYLQKKDLLTKDLKLFEKK
jgi:hypothetical protein